MAGFHRLAGIVLGLAALACSTGEAAAQPTMARVVGRVLDHRTGEPVSGASIRAGAGAAVTSDGLGWFALSLPLASPVILQTTMIGYAARADTVPLDPRRTTEVTIRLAVDPVQLAPLAIVVRSGWLEDNGYYDRRYRSGLSGHWIDAAEIERRNPMVMTDLLHGVASVKVHNITVGVSVVRFSRQKMMGLTDGGAAGDLPARVRAMLRLPGCEPTLYIDGRKHVDRLLGGGLELVEDFNVLSPAVIEAIEVYVGANVPTQYRGHGCGVILVWSKRNR